MKTINLSKLNELLSAAKTLLKAKIATKQEAAPAKAAESEAAR